MLDLDPATVQCLPLEGRRAHTQALDLLVSWARRQIGLFDHDLGDTGWNGSERIRLLTDFLQGSRLARCEIFLRDAGRITARFPRLANLLRSHGHAVTIYQVGEDAQALYDPFLIVDGRHYWHRFHYEQARGEIGVQQPQYASELARRLHEIKEVSAPAAQTTVLGL